MTGIVWSAKPLIFALWPFTGNWTRQFLRYRFLRKESLGAGVGMGDLLQYRPPGPAPGNSHAVDLELGPAISDFKWHSVTFRKRRGRALQALNYTDIIAWFLFTIALSF